MTQQDSTFSLLATTMILSFTSLGYIFHYFQKRIDDLEKNKRDIDTEDLVDENVFQAWSGTFADGQNSLIATLVWKKEHSRKKNSKWVDWNGEQDGSLTNRDFYIQKENPSFDWRITKREFDTKAVVKETFMDGWNSVILLKITVFVGEEKTNNEMNYFFKNLVEANQIDWQKSLLPLNEINQIFE
jgi:hypothetical protein